MEKLKSLWSRWKVQISFVAGAFVVSTTKRTSSFEPAVSPATTGTTTTETTTGTTTGTTDGAIVGAVDAINDIATGTTDNTTDNNGQQRSERKNVEWLSVARQESGSMPILNSERLKNDL